jgi:hypothetical protein
MCPQAHGRPGASEEQEFQAVEVAKVSDVIGSERGVEVYGGRRNPGIVL